MHREPIGAWPLRTAALILAAAAAMMLSCGSWRGATPPEPPPSPPPLPAAPANRPAADLEAPQPVEGGSQDISPAVPGTAAGEPPGAAAAPATPAETVPAGQAEGPGSPHGGEPGSAGENTAKSLPERREAAPRNGAPKGPDGHPARIAVARLPEHLTFDQTGPFWTRGPEELVYRVEFLGMTMGYARFVFNGKVLLGGREVYHLSVRAWTSNVLALIYPVNDTIDYYMDVKTLAPLRQEYTSGNRKKDDVMVYDQETGKIVYRYKESGEIRKQVDAVPNVYDPVTLAYFFRSREAGDEKGRNVYAGRKVWEISARPLGDEKISTERGEVDTIVIQPVIKRDGKVENKGDLRMWMTRDERKIPVRVYAKFKKIRTWTLVGELMPERKGG